MRTEQEAETVASDSAARASRTKNAPVTLSPYDPLFQRYSRQIGWDWRLLCAVCYHESRFNPLTVSPAGARSIMQLTPVTAARFGLNESNITDPEAGIEAGVQYIKYLKMVYRHVPDSADRVRFVLASYNAGPAHIIDARQLAWACGSNPYRWQSVEPYLLRLSDPRYYKDPACLYGRFNARPTVAYVHAVDSTYQAYRRLTD